MFCVLVPDVKVSQRLYVFPLPCNQ